MLTEEPNTQETLLGRAANADYWMRSGQTHIMKRDYSSAVESFDKCIQASTILPGCEKLQKRLWLHKANALLELRRFAEVPACYSAAIQYDPENGNLWLSHADSLMAVNKLSQAAESYKKVADTSPGQQLSMDALLGQARALYEMRKLIPALKFFQEVAEREPTHSGAKDGQLLIARQLVEDGRVRDGVEAYCALGARIPVLQPSIDAAIRSAKRKAFMGRSG
jgi:tetratricopeptide (TPR) repeat protein